jgi:hypothetical protein
VKVMKKCQIAMMLIAICLFNFASIPAQKTDWGAWNNTQYNGIDFRVKCLSYNDYAKKYTWDIQFRNRYQKTVYFNYAYAEPETTVTRTTNRGSLSSGNTGSGHQELLNTSCNSSYVKVYIDKVRVGEDSGPYINPN